MTATRSSRRPTGAPTRRGRWLPGGAAALALLSCVPMAAMLPAAAATAFSILGVDATSGPWAAARHALDPIAQPLLIASVLLLIATTLRCGRGPALLVTAGGTALYFSMYVLPSAGSNAMANMSAPGAPGNTSTQATNAPLFYTGIALIALTFIWSAIRRRRHTCSPAWRRPAHGRLNEA